MTNRESGDKPPALGLASANTDHDIDILHAKQRAARKLASLAAAILRTISGSPSVASIMQSALEYFDAQKKLVALTGCLLTHEEEKAALSLAERHFSPDWSETRYREYMYEAGIEKIVRGALRSAAHQVLKEREPFGGKYSSLAIEEGIAGIVRATSGPQKRKRNRRKVVL